jgi:hypothetical protein
MLYKNGRAKNGRKDNADSQDDLAVPVDDDLLQALGRGSYTGSLAARPT